MRSINEACMEHYGPMLMLAKWGPMGLIALGALLLGAAVYAYLKLEKPLLSSIILVAIGLGLVTLPFTGSVPAIGGPIEKLGIEKVSMFDLYGKIIGGCSDLQKQASVPDDPGTGGTKPEVQETFDHRVNEDTDGLPNLDKYAGLGNVWVYYRPNRDGDASVVESLVSVSSIPVFGAMDDLSGVFAQKPPGSARIIFTDMTFFEFAYDVAKSIELEIPGEVYLEGPYPTIRSGPIQVQLF